MKRASANDGSFGKANCHAPVLFLRRGPRRTSGWADTFRKDFGQVREAVGGPDGAVYAVVNDPDEILRISARGRTAR